MRLLRIAVRGATRIRLLTLLVVLEAVGLELLGHCHDRVTQARAYLVHLQFHDRAVRPVLRLVGALLQTARHDHAHALLQRLGDVAGHVAPCAAAHEQGLTVLVLVRLTVPHARRGSNREIRDRRPGADRADFRVCRQVAHNGERRLSGHHLLLLKCFLSAYSTTAETLRDGRSTVMTPGFGTR